MPARCRNQAGDLHWRWGHRKQIGVQLAEVEHLQGEATAQGNAPTMGQTVAVGDCHATRCAAFMAAKGAGAYASENNHQQQCLR